MKKHNLIGLVLCCTLFVFGFFIHGNLSLYFNVSGLLIVLSGTIGASLLSFRTEQLQIVYTVVRSSFIRPSLTEREVIRILIDLSVKSRIDGVLSLQKEENETSILFLRRALGCLVDGYTVDQIREILNTEMYFFRLRREDSERVLRTIADFFPAFGIIGSVVGLITMLGGIGDTSIILRAVPIALTSTLYGLIFANFFFLPFAANLKERTDQELLLQKIITEGVVAIESEINPLILKTKLESFLTPSARDLEYVSYEKIKQRFNIEEEQESETSIDEEHDEQLNIRLS